MLDKNIRRSAHYIYILGVLLFASSILIIELNEKFGEVLDKSYISPIYALNAWLLILLGIILIPIIEEFCFRLWLKKKYFWGIFLMIGALFIMASGWMTKTLIGVIIILVIIFYKRLKTFSQRKPYFALLISSLLFSLGHLFNFDEFTLPLAIIIFLFLGLGLILGMIRMQLGLWASILLHILYNFAIIGMMLPSLNTQNIDLNGAVLLEHGLMDNKTKYYADTAVICDYCDDGKLLYKVMSRAYPDNLISINTGENNPIRKYSLIEKQEFNIESMANQTLSHFNMFSEVSTDTLDVFYIQFLENSEFAWSLENFLKHNPKSINEWTFSQPFMLTEFLEMTYSTKIKCTEGCNETRVIPLKSTHSLQADLDQLVEKNLITYHILREEKTVMRISK